ncbi:MAG: hypothetical protein HRO68_09920 [Nitrosopumilus sp.]|nr:hypothetical protein [Nitrosopumilus sp.]
MNEESVKPDSKFLESFAVVLGDKWPSLAASLCFSAEEIEEVKKEGKQRDHALQMLKKWVSMEGATYGLLCQTLKSVSLF